MIKQNKNIRVHHKLRTILKQQTETQSHLTWFNNEALRTTAKDALRIVQAGVKQAALNI